MRKKSHIILARYIVRESRDRELKKHIYAFYLGSVLPDIKPSFLYRRHEITETFPAWRERINELSRETPPEDGRHASRYFRQLGEISHYLADYFTYPHNDKFTGGLRRHCSYEQELKKKLRRHITSGKAASRKKKFIHFSSPEDLFKFVENSHEEYIDSQNSVEDDISHIVPINSQVIRSVREFTESGK